MVNEVANKTEDEIYLMDEEHEANLTKSFGGMDRLTEM